MPSLMKSHVHFELPPKGSLTANGQDDSLNYYYHPVLGALYCARNQQTLSLIGSQERFSSVLELGYGSGVMMPSLARIADAVYGIDIETDPEIVQRNLLRLGVRAQCSRGDIRQMNFADETFDLVFSVSTLQYFADPAPVLEEAARVLRPGGKFLVGMPRVAPFMDKLFSFFGFHRSGLLHHGDYRKLIQSAQSNFELVSLKHLPFFLPRSCGLYFSMLFRKMS